MRRIARLAGRQKGNVTRRQLRELGLSAAAIDEWLKAGRLILKFRGVYRLAHEGVPEFSDELAAVMACSPDALLGDRSASSLWRILPPCPPAEPVSVIVIGRDARSRPGIRVRHAGRLPGDERTTHDGIPVTTPARTLLDLAAVAEPPTLERAINEARALRLVRPATLVSLLARHPRHRGAPALRALLDRPPDGSTRSEAERRFLELVTAAGLPPPRVNSRVGRYEVDFLWPDQRLVVEIDGYAFHSSRASFERDRARDADLTARGYRVVRFTWRQLTAEPHAVVARLAQALVA